MVPQGNTRRAKRGEFQPDGKPYTHFSPSSIDQYVKAIMDLYALQRSTSMGLVAYDSPRGWLLKTYLRSLCLKEVKRIRPSYEDRGAGTFRDEYTPDELTKVSMYYFGVANEAPMRNR